MKRRIISSILSIAMIISLFTVAFVNPVGAAAEELSQYAKDRAALKDALRTLYSKGPTLSADIVSKYFVNYGVITDADVNEDTKEYVIVEKRAEFEKKMPDYSIEKYFIKDATVFNSIFGTSGKVILDGKVVWDISATAKDNIEAVVKYASAVYYFGQNENDENVDASFNEGRNAVVKETTDLVNAVIKGLKDQVGENNNKPAAYADIYTGVDYKGFLSAAYKYHPSLGVNPFYNVGSGSSFPFAPFYNDSYYTQIGVGIPLTPVKWYTFEEIRANADWNKLLVAFEFELRKLHTAAGAGVLYHDFVYGEKAAFTKSFDDLCKAIIGNVFMDDQKIDMTKEIKAYLKLKKVVDIYNLYVKDLYNNIYTAPDMELLSNVLIAARFVDFIGNDWSKVLALKAADIEGLANKIVASIEAFVPRADQAIDAASLASGVKAVKDAKALVASYPETEGNKVVRNALISAAKTLEDMLPAASGKAFISVAKDFDKMEDAYAKEIKGDKFTISFTPNYFAFIKYKALLDAALGNFYTNVNAYKLVPSASSSIDNLKNILDKYGYLVGVVGPVIGPVVDGTVSAKITELTKEYAVLLFDEAAPAQGGAGAITAIDLTATPAPRIVDYFQALLYSSSASLGLDGAVTTIYEKVVGYVFNSADNYDAAIENVYYFADQFDKALKVYINGPAAGDDGVFTDWESGTVTVKNGYDKAADALKAALAFLTKDLTVYVQTVKYNLEKLAGFFYLVNVANPTADYEILAANTTYPADGQNWTFVNNYPEKYLENFVKAANAVKKIVYDTVLDSDSNVAYNRATFSKLVAAEKAFIAATKALLSDLGDARLDAYLADVQRASAVNYGTAGWNYQLLADKLVAANVVPGHYILTTTARNYEYFAFTLASVVAWNASANYFAFDAAAATSRFELNYLSALNSALAISTDASGYARDAADKASKLLQSGSALQAAIKITGTDPSRAIAVNTDMPLWYAQKLLADIQGIPAMLNANSVAAIAAKKAAVGGLNELLDKAAALNVYDYIVGENKDYDKIWEAFMAAYNAGVKVSYDKTVPLADIDAAVEVLEKAMAALEDIKRPEDGEVITVDDFKAAIAAAEAVVARYDLAESLAVVNDLKEVINKANKLLTYNISVLTAGELKAEIKKLNDAAAAVLEAIYVGDALKADLEALAAGIDKDKYTEESYNAAVKAYEAAMAVAASDTATVSECKAALESVKAAIAALVVKPVEVVSDTRKEAIATYEKAVEDYAGLVSSEKYSAESLANLQAAIDALKAGIDGNVSDAQLIDLIVKLRLANAALVVAPTHTSDD